MRPRLLRSCARRPTLVLGLGVLLGACGGKDASDAAVDADGDGLDDLLIGAYANGDGSVDAGVTYLLTDASF